MALSPTFNVSEEKFDGVDFLVSNSHSISPTNLARLLVVVEALVDGRPKAMAVSTMILKSSSLARRARALMSTNLESSATGLGRRTVWKRLRPEGFDDDDGCTPKRAPTMSCALAISS